VARVELAGAGHQWRATHTLSGGVWTVDTAAAAAGAARDPSVGRP
jgi:nitrogen fixation protein FixH